VATLVHELSHTLMGLDEGWNIIFAENPAREALNLKPRLTFDNHNVVDWFLTIPNSVMLKVESHVDRFLQEWSSP
jgi:hypothetical protein